MYVSHLKWTGKMMVITCLHAIKLFVHNSLVMESKIAIKVNWRPFDFVWRRKRRQCQTSNKISHENRAICIVLQVFERLNIFNIMTPFVYNQLKNKLIL